MQGTLRATEVGSQQEAEVTPTALLQRQLKDAPGWKPEASVSVDTDLKINTVATRDPAHTVAGQGPAYLPRIPLCPTIQTIIS